MGGDILWWDPRFPGQAVRNLKAYTLKSDDRMTAFSVQVRNKYRDLPRANIAFSPCVR